MAGPWERYAPEPPPQQQEAAGPWARYAEPEHPAQQNSTAAVAANAFGRGLSGLLGLPGTIADASQSLMNRGYQALTGREVSLPGNPLSADRIQGGLRSAGILDRPGTEPQTTGQHYAAAAAEGAGAGLPFGVGSALLGAAGGAAGEGAARGAANMGAGEGVQTGARIAGNIGGGMAAGALARGLGRVVAPIRGDVSPERAALVQTADTEGIPLSPAQRSGSSVLQSVEGAFANMPLTRGVEQTRRAATQEGFNRAALRRAGVDAPRATPEVLAQAQDEIGGQIGAIAARNNASFSGGAGNRLLSLAQDATENADDTVGRLVSSRVRQVLDRLQDGDVMPGQAWRELDSAIAAQIRGNRQNGDLTHRLGQLREIMRDALESGGISGEDLTAFRQARRQYANLMTVENAAGSAGGAGAVGDLSPAQLRGALVNSVGRRGYSTGQGDLNPLARVGDGILRQQVPDSGTAQRTMMAGLLSGGGVAPAMAMGASAPMMAGAAAAGLAMPRAIQGAYYSGMGQRYLAPPGIVRGAFTRALPGPMTGATAGAANSAQQSATEFERSSLARLLRAATGE